MSISEGAGVDDRRRALAQCLEQGCKRHNGVAGIGRAVTDGDRQPLGNSLDLHEQPALAHAGAAFDNGDDTRS
jgi:hypothetical protein